MRPLLSASAALALFALFSSPAVAEEDSKEQAPADDSAAQAPAEEMSSSESPSVKAGFGPDREVRADGAPPIEVVKTDDGRCIFTDLQGAFTITLNCDLMDNHTGHSQDQKRIWLASPRGQFNIIEIPEPYRTAEFDFVMGNLGRFWTKDKTVQAATPTTIAGMEAVTTTERHARSTVRNWIVRIGGRNVIVKASGFGKNRKVREAFLEELSQAFLDGFKLTE